MIAADDPRLAAYRQIRTAPPLADRHGEPAEALRLRQEQRKAAIRERVAARSKP